MEDCVFCDILAGRSPVSLIHEDEICVAFMDIRPVNEGHALVIPRGHYPYLADAPPDAVAHLACVGQRVAAALRASGVACDGVNMFVADGEAAGQEVFHLHLHVYPRFEGDGFGFRYDDRHFQFPPRKRLNEIAERLRGEMRTLK